MNYILTDVKRTRKKYPNHNERKFMSVQEYHDLSRRIIGKFAPPNVKRAMLTSEDAIDFVAHCIMRADWGYDKEHSKGANLRTYRGYCGRRAIKTYLGIIAEQRKTLSLDYLLLEDKSLHDTQSDDGANDPQKQHINSEQHLELKIYLGSILEKLTETQRECIIRSHIKNKGHSRIARELGISREAVRKSINVGMKKMRELVVKGFRDV